MSTTDPSPPPEVRDWEAVQSSPEFQDALMDAKIGGNITVALVFGLLQFVSTFAITWWYVRFADRRLDPLAEQLRSELEADK